MPDLVPLDWLLVAQAVASGAMCGVIWFVQVVHYPLFVRAGGADAHGYAVENQRRTSWVVLPFMAIEAVAAARIAFDPPVGIGRTAAVAGGVAVVALWLSTLAVQMPLHGRLASTGHDRSTVAALVRGNWFRTVLWTFRAILAAWMLRVA